MLTFKLTLIALAVLALTALTAYALVRGVCEELDRRREARRPKPLRWVASKDGRFGVYYAGDEMTHDIRAAWGYPTEAEAKQRIPAGYTVFPTYASF